MQSLWFAHVVRAFWVGFAAAAILAYPIFHTLLRLKSRQTVSQYAPEGHQKKQGTPTMGGLILVAGAIVALLVSAIDTRGLWPWLLLLVGYAVIGFVDDFVVPRMMAGKRGLGWKQKILMQLVVALGAALLTRGRFDLEGGVLVFLILFFSNAYNFSDGLDGLAGTLLLALGLGLIACAGVIDTPIWAVVPVAALVGAVIPFLFLNAPPAKIFMGDVGSLPVGAALGLTIGVVGLETLPRETLQTLPTLAVMQGSSDMGRSPLVMLSLVVLSLVMIAELVPVPLQILSVKLRKKKIFPYTPIHHAFEKAGWPETRVVWHFALVQLLCSALALAMLVGFPRMGSRFDPEMRTTFNR